MRNSTWVIEDPEVVELVRMVRKALDDMGAARLRVPDLQDAVENVPIDEPV
jgi:predicted nucleic acid-binding protein